MGDWSWTFIEGVGRITFTSDHKVTEGFPPDDKDGRTIRTEEFDIVRAGSWRLEGDVLITEMNNTPLIKIMERLDPRNRPPFEAKVERRRIVKIDDQNMVFDDGYSLARVHR